MPDSDFFMNCNKTGSLSGKKRIRLLHLYSRTSTKMEMMLLLIFNLTYYSATGNNEYKIILDAEQAFEYNDNV
jgi:hypothetical protein